MRNFLKTRNEMLKILTTKQRMKIFSKFKFNDEECINEKTNAINTNVELTDEEIAQMEVDRAAAEADRAAAEAIATAKAEAKASALAKLAALGLTAEEAAAITS
jgi:hypothetical protein